MVFKEHKLYPQNNVYFKISASYCLEQGLCIQKICLSFFLSFLFLFTSRAAKPWKLGKEEPTPLKVFGLGEETCYHPRLR